MQLSVISLVDKNGRIDEKGARRAKAL